MACAMVRPVAAQTGFIEAFITVFSPHHGNNLVRMLGVQTTVGKVFGYLNGNILGFRSKLLNIVGRMMKGHGDMGGPDQSTAPVHHRAQDRLFPQVN